MWHMLRGRGSRLLGAGYALGRLGQAGPPSRLSLAEGARRPWAVLASAVGDVEASMATVPCRTGVGHPVRRPVAMPASGFGGSGPHCGHTPSCHRYVGVVLVGAVLAGFLESAFFVAGSGESGSSMAGFLESATPWLSWGEVAEDGSPSESRLQR